MVRTKKGISMLFEKNIPVEFTTERLVLKALTAKDADFIKRLTNSEGWLQFIGDRNIRSESQAIEYIEKIASTPYTQYYKVILKHSQTPIGVITLIKRDYLEDVDIGFAFLHEHTKKGYALEASAMMLQTIMNYLETNRVLAITLPENESSIHLLKKLGMSFRNVIHRDGEDLLVYAFSK